MATQKSLTEIVCDAVRALQESKGSRTNQIFSYAKEVTQNEEINLGKIKLALKNAVDKEMLNRTNDGRFSLNLPDVPTTDVKNTDVQDMKNEEDPIIDSSCGCPRKRRRRSCRPKRKRCRSRRRKRKSCRRSCTKMWVPKRRRRCRSKKRRRSCKPRRRRRCCTPIWVPKRKRCHRR